MIQARHSIGSMLALSACILLAGCSQKAAEDKVDVSSRPGKPEIRVLKETTTPSSEGPSDEAAHADRDVEVFAQLRLLGADLPKPRHTLFYLYFPTEAARQECKKSLLESSLKSEKQFAVDATVNGELGLFASAVMVVDEKRIAGLRKELVSIAKKHGGEFDGWECAPQP